MDEASRQEEAEEEEKRERKEADAEEEGRTQSKSGEGSRQKRAKNKLLDDVASLRRVLASRASPTRCAALHPMGGPLQQSRWASVSVSPAT